MQLAPRAVAALALAVGSTIGVTMTAIAVQRLAAEGVSRVDDAVALAVLSLGLVLLLWYLVTAVVALACLARRAIGGAWTAGERRLARAGAPLARRLLGAGAGAVVAAAAVLAPAAAVPGTPMVISDDLGWGADGDRGDDGGSEPDRDASTADPAGEAPAADGPTPVSPSGSTDRPGTGTPAAQPVGSTSEATATTYTVGGGDSLWVIAAVHLPDSAGPADIAAAWPDWYELNRDVIGSDPDLIHPGQVLVAPDHHPEEDA